VRRTVQATLDAERGDRVLARLSEAVAARSPERVAREANPRAPRRPPRRPRRPAPFLRVVSDR
jgi:hypothetical protein